MAGGRTSRRASDDVPCSGAGEAGASVPACVHQSRSRSPSSACADLPSPSLLISLTSRREMGSQPAGRYLSRLEPARAVLTSCAAPSWGGAVVETPSSAADASDAPLRLIGRGRLGGGDGTSRNR